MNNSQLLRIERASENRLSGYGYGAKLKYFGNSNYQEITEVLTRLAPECDTCGASKLYFCLDCETNVVVCYTCDKNEHLCHEINELHVLFLEPSSCYDNIHNVWVSKESILDQMISLVGVLKQIKDKNRWKNNYERRAQQIVQIVEIRDYLLAEKLNFRTSYPLQELKEIINRALITKRNSMAGKVLYLRHEWKINRQKFEKVYAEFRFKAAPQSKPARPSCFQKVCELDLASRRNNRGLGEISLSSLMGKYMFDQPKIVKEATMNKFVGSVWVESGLPISEKRCAFLSMQKSKLWSVEIPKRLALKSWTETSYSYDTQLSNQAQTEKHPKSSLFAKGCIEEIYIASGGFPLDQSPKDLKAMSISINLREACNLPQQLRKANLNLGYGQISAVQLRQLLESMMSMIHLRQLTINTSSTLDPSIIRLLLLFAIDKNLMAISIGAQSNSYLRQPADRVSVLKRHYTAYRRTLVQGMLLIKRNKIGGTYWAESILQHSEASTNPIHRLLDFQNLLAAYRLQSMRN